MNKLELTERQAEIARRYNEHLERVGIMETVGETLERIFTETDQELDLGDRELNEDMSFASVVDELIRLHGLQGFVVPMVTEEQPRLFERQFEVLERALRRKCAETFKQTGEPARITYKVPASFYDKLKRAAFRVYRMEEVRPDLTVLFMKNDALRFQTPYGTVTLERGS